MKKVIISGIYGQDACWMSRILLDEGWEVYGLTRPSTNKNPWRLKEEGILDNPNLKIIECDITDCTGVFSIVNKLKPDWFINLAAISAVGTSFDCPIDVAKIDGLAPVYCLEAIRQFSPETKFYQASTSEMIANSKNEDGFADENTRMEPVSPYAAAKLYAYNMVKIYREAYGIQVYSSILYNHGSKYRGEYFIERKIGQYVAQLACNKDYEFNLILGNLDASRDIGHAKEYMEAVSRIMCGEPDDYTVSTGKTYTIREMLEIAFSYIDLDWQDYVKIDSQFLRKNEVHHLLGDNSKIRNKLGWQPTKDCKDVLTEIIESDIKRINNGRQIFNCT